MMDGRVDVLFLHLIWGGTATHIPVRTLPWSTWPMMVTTGARGRRVAGSSSSKPKLCVGCWLFVFGWGGVGWRQA